MDETFRIYSPAELNSMSDDERKVALGGEFGRSFHVSAASHVTWIFWARNVSEPTEILGHASAFLLDRGNGAMLVTAAHVYKEYAKHREEFGDLYCQIANTKVRDLSRFLIDCGNDEGAGADIATFRLPDGAAERIGIRPLLAPCDHWPAPPKQNEQALFGGYPGQERIQVGSDAINFGFHSGMLPISSITEHQISLRIEREFLLDAHGTGIPRPGYGLGGISGAPLLVPNYKDGQWSWRLGGVISQATEERPAEEVLFDMIVAHRAEYILPDGKLLKGR